MPSVEEKLKEIVVKIVHCDEKILTPTSTWQEMKADSSCSIFIGDLPLVFFCSIGPSYLKIHRSPTYRDKYKTHSPPMSRV